MKYKDIVEYNGSQLFSGAIDLDNYLDNPKKASDIVSSYVFHGKKNHIAANSTGHKFTDTITFIENILGFLEVDEPEILLGIAGYGVGKSHLALTLSSVLSSVDSDLRNEFFKKINKIDSDAASRINEMLSVDNRPYLVIPINGMRNEKLIDIVFKNLKRILDRDGVSTKCIDRFDPRYIQLASTLAHYDEAEKVQQLLSSCGLDMEHFLSAMDESNSAVYQRVYSRLNDYDITYFEPRAIGALKDLIRTAADELCGSEKPYRAMLIVFDEFGKYMSFAAANKDIAGDGCLQDLHEGIQATRDVESGHAVLLGFSQLELENYKKGVADSGTLNELDRYVSRFEGAKRYYLSACFETLVFNLIKPLDEECVPSLGDVNYITDCELARKNLNSNFRSFSANDLWNDSNSFIKLICRGCWPLSPYLMWTLTYVTSENELLQQRSGFNILAKLFDDYIYNFEFNSDYNWVPAVAIYDCGLGSDLVASEIKLRNGNPVATEYKYFRDKYANVLSVEENKVLQAIVLSHKLGASCVTQKACDELLSYLSGLDYSVVLQSLDLLMNQYNAVIFDLNANLYNINSNSVSWAQFNSVIDRYKNNYIFGKSRSELFEIVVTLIKTSQDFEEIRKKYFVSLECDFKMKHNITSPEWVYAPYLIVGYDYLNQIKELIDVKKYLQNSTYDCTKGTFVYIVLPNDVSVSKVKESIADILTEKCSEANFTLPFIFKIVQDNEDKIKDSAIDLYVLGQLSPDDATQYASHINKKKVQLIDEIDSEFKKAILTKEYVYPIESKSHLKVIARLIFENAYPKILPFQVDGTNWANTCQTFSILLSQGGITRNDFTNLGIASANRAITLFDQRWKACDSKGNICRMPGLPVIADIFKQLDSSLENCQDVKVLDIVNLLTAPPYGANTTEATLLVCLYLSTRIDEVDMYYKDALTPLNTLTSMKGSFDKYKAFNKIKWDDIFFRKAIRDDAKWISLVNRWSQSTDFVEILQCNAEEQQLESLKVSIPASVTIKLSQCVSRTQALNNKYQEWQVKSSKIKKSIEQAIENEKIGTTLHLYAREYSPLYRYTLGSFCDFEPAVDIPEHISVEDEEFRTYVLSFIDASMDEWQQQHPIDFKCDKTMFDEIVKKYENTIEALNLIEEYLIANDLKADCQEAKDKRSSWIRYRNCKREVSIKFDSVRNSLNQGLFTSSQVLSYKEQLENLLKDIDKFSAEDLLASEGSFDNLKSDINNSLAAVDSFGKSKDEDFAKLFDMDISTKEDLDIVEKTASELIIFYQGIGNQQNSNLEDAKILQQESRLLKSILQSMRDSSLSLKKLDSLIEKSKKSIDDTLNGEACYDDEMLIDRFAIPIKADIKKRSKDWIRNISSNMEKANTVREVDCTLFMLSSIPSYAEGLVEDEMKRIEQKAKEKKSDMRLDNIKSLFDLLSKGEQVDFMKWCDKNKK